MDLCSPERLLSSHDVKITRTRTEILSLILNTEKPFCPADIKEMLGSEFDLVTIYRNLTVFAERGIIREVLNKDDRQYFELACEHNPVHPHFLCSGCGNIYCMSPKQDFSMRPKNSEGFLITEVNIQFKGICPSCR